MRPTKFNIGDKPNFLKIINLHRRDERNHIVWWVKCDCGVEREISNDVFKSVKFCSFKCPLASKCTIQIGLRYKNIIVESLKEKKGKFYYFNCRCDCGNTVVFNNRQILILQYLSCGCIKYKKEIKPKVLHTNNDSYIDNKYIVGATYNKWYINKLYYKNNKKYISVTCTNGHVKDITRAVFNHSKHSCKICTYKNRQQKRADIFLNKKFNKLTIKEYLGVNNYTSLMFSFVCECGNTGTIREFDIGKVKSCGCEMQKKYCNDISQSFFGRFQNNAKSRNIEFDITIQDIWNIYIEQNRKCALSGVDLVFFKGKKNNKLTNVSIDRIDSNQGYLINNIQLVHKTINIMKNALSDQEFILWCNTVSSFNKKV